MVLFRELLGTIFILAPNSGQGVISTGGYVPLTLSSSLIGQQRPTFHARREAQPSLGTSWHHNARHLKDIKPTLRRP